MSVRQSSLARVVPLPRDSAFALRKKPNAIVRQVQDEEYCCSGFEPSERGAGGSQTHMSVEYIEIKVCPECRNSHKYALDVERTIVLFSRPPENWEIRRRRFTRLMTCPRTNGEFQATLSLSDSIGDRIRSVRVQGPVKDE